MCMIIRKNPITCRCLLIHQPVSPVVLQIKTWTKLYMVHTGGVVRVDIHSRKSQVCLVLGLNSVCASVPPESSYIWPCLVRKSTNVWLLLPEVLVTLLK